MSYSIIRPFTGRKSQYSFALSQIAYFEYTKKPGTFGVSNRILQDTGRKPFEKALPGKPGQI